MPTTLWIDGAECLGAGTCEQIAPEVFSAHDDGTWVVKEDAAFFGVNTVFDGGDGPGHGPSGPSGIARVPEPLIESIIDAAEQCPGECIHVEVRR